MFGSYVIDQGMYKLSMQEVNTQGLYLEIRWHG
mgnify:CR=1 FL=1